MHLQPPRFSTTVSAQPSASPLARYQAARGTAVTNLRHETTVLDAVARQVLTRLDGTRSRAVVLAELLELARRGDVQITQAGAAVSGEDTLRRAVLWRKRSFGCGSAAGCRFVERILTVVQTRRWQGKNVLDYLQDAFWLIELGSLAPS